jgi:hypothetical protein
VVGDTGKLQNRVYVWSHSMAETKAWMLDREIKGETMALFPNALAYGSLSTLEPYGASRGTRRDILEPYLSLCAETDANSTIL